MIRLSARLCCLFIVSGFCGPVTASELSPAELSFFEKEIRPILIENCYDCHSAESKIKGGLRLDYGPGVAAGGESGPALVAGDPEASLLIEAVRYRNRDMQMPPKNRLPAHQVAALEKWVRMGAPDPREADPQSGEKPVMGMSIAEGKAFWSFQQVATPEVPEFSGEDFVKTPIDAFILAKLREKKLTPAPPADRRDLIRRLTQNMIGLPPTEREIEDFLGDETPQALETVIDRLLASPHYGVRWGRHWLDVARYADSNGLDENLGFGQAWRYRDWVVDSFNGDKPFDRFLIEQIAGDLVPGADRETVTGTGYLQLGPKILAEPDRKKLDMDIIDEQLDTLGKTFLGMTFGCVRCHDHKFDPVKQTDYYALAAIFKSTKTLGPKKTGAIKHWYEHSFSDEEEKARIKEIDGKLAEKKKAASTFKSSQVSAIRSEARAKAADYLVVATQFEVDAPLTEIERLAKPLGLHPRILHHCRIHLDYHRDDPFFVEWHRLAAERKTDRIRSHYQSVFDEAEAAFAEAKKKDPKVTVLKDKRLQAARAALYKASGFLAVPTVDGLAFDEETLVEYHRLLDEARAFEIMAPDETAVMGVGEGAVVPALAIHIRGSHKNLGSPVAREFPEVMRTSQVRPVFPANGSGRLELARWMADSRHPLTARVIVNRIWSWHFGKGLVQTTENFGVKGGRPSHPELLDWLTREFMAHGWSIKHLHRLILTSSTYRMKTRHPREKEYLLVDSENRFIWKANLQRLEAEQIRDSILAVSGRLDQTLGGKTLPLRNRQFVFNHTSEDHTKYDSVRRAIYLPVIRNNLYSLFEQFDYPDPTMPTGTRNSTVIAPQALVMMNYELVMDSADAFARDVVSATADDGARVTLAYQRALGRKPSPNESERVLEFISGVSSEAPTGAATVDPAAKQRGWSLFCQSLLVSNEFLYLR